MSEMIERVARAALAALTDDRQEGGALVQGDVSEVLIDGTFDMRIVARAAIEAMREPTDAMWAAGDEQGCREIYRRMIDAALRR